jgi:hypothetical protein
MASDLLEWRYEVAPAAWQPRGPDDPYTGGIAVAQRTCSAPGCDRPHLARGWCGLHYRQWKRTWQLCSIEGCGKPVKGRGWCTAHYARWRKYGTTDDPRASLAERFWAKVDRRGPNECWPWVGAKLQHGYGHLKVGDSYPPAHRVAYELLVGLIPEGLQIDHLCRNRACCNPAHMEPVTPLENTRRGDATKWRGVICATAECSAPAAILGLCDRCYHRAWRRQRPTHRPPSTGSEP